MFVRALIFGDCRMGEASISVRIERALMRAGHAVQLCCPYHNGTARAIAASKQGFRPSIVFVEGRVANRFPEETKSIALLELPVVITDGCVSQLLDNCVNLIDLYPALVDEDYLHAITPLPKAEIYNDVLVMQEKSDIANQCVAKLEENGRSIALLDETWGRAFVDLDRSVAAFEARCCRVALIFDGDDAPSLTQAALRVAEGSVVIADRLWCERWGGNTAQLFAAAEETSIADKVNELLNDDRLLMEMRSAQLSWIKQLPMLSTALKKLLGEGGPLAGAAIQKSPARRVVVFGWFGMQNFGDDLLLETVANQVELRFSEAVVQVIGGDPRRIREETGRFAVRASEHYEMRRLIKYADAVVFCGGLIFDDPMTFTPGGIELFVEPYMDPGCQAAVCLMAWQHGVPALYLGAGMGPVSKPATIESLRYIGLAGTRLLLRDNDSVELALKAGVNPAQVAPYADLALCSRPAIEAHASSILPEGLKEGHYVMVSLRSWPLNPAGFVDNMASELDRVASETGLDVVFVPFDPDDAEIHHAVAAKMSMPSREVTARLAPADMFAVIKGSAMAIAMRLHCSILHHVLGKPAVGINYNEKVGSHFIEMGRGDYLVGLNDIVGNISSAAIKAAADPTAQRDQIEQGLSIVSPKAEKAFEELFASIEGHVVANEAWEREVFHPRTRSDAAVEVVHARAREVQLRARISELECELSESRSRVRDLEQSTSYRLGNALVKVPHALFKRSR